MKKSVVNYTLNSCVKCLKCIRACPVSALSMHENRISIDHSRCINCAQCISTCHSKGLLAHGSTLEDLANYSYTVCLVPPALVSSCSTLDEANQLFYAIKQLGFDEVVDTSDIYGVVMKETIDVSDQFTDMTVIASFCPVINRLIETKYPMLLDNLTPINYPSEVAAKHIREKYKDKENVGIFNLCECEAKLNLAKYPYGNAMYEVDHALAIVEIFPKIREHLEEGRIPQVFNREGIQSTNPALMLQNPKFLIADGYDKISNILDMAEFGLLKDFSLLYLFPCFNGCAGGHLLFGNSYLYRNNMFPLTEKSKPMIHLPFEQVYSDAITITSEDERTFVEKMQFFKSVNEQLEQLPGYDCSACGMQTCRIMAEEIAKGNKTIQDCHIIRAKSEGGSHDN